MSNAIAVDGNKRNEGAARQSEPSVHHPEAELSEHAIAGAATVTGSAAVKAAAEAVKHGEIPDILIESWQLVDPRSPGGLVFQNEWLTRAKELYASEPAVPGRNKASERFSWLLTHDFEKEPVQFVRSSLPDANAWYIKGSIPITIVICDGLLSPSAKNRNSAPIQCEENALDIVGHEMTHGKLFNRFGHKWNSKFEEGVANAVPARLLHYMGKDPRAVLELNDRLNPLQPRAPIGFHDIIDPHPIKKTMKAVYEGALTEIGSTIAGVPVGAVRTTQLQPGMATLTARSGSHESWLAKRLTGSPTYAQMSAKAKIAALTGEIAAAVPPFAVRLRDIASEMKRLGPILDLRRDARFIDRAVDAIFELNTNHRNFENVEGGRTSAMAGLIYNALCTNCGVTPGLPIGKRLTTVSEKMAVLVDEGEQADVTGIKSASAHLMTAIAADPFISSPENQSFLTGISWPTFEMPDLGRVARRPVTPPWQTVAELAFTNPTVACAAVALGLGGDVQVELGMRRAAIDALYASIERNASGHEIGGGHPLSVGPRNVDAGMTTMEQDSHGLIIGIRDAPRSLNFTPPKGTIAEHLVSRIESNALDSIDPKALAPQLLFDSEHLPKVLISLLKHPATSCSDELLETLVRTTEFSPGGVARPGGVRRFLENLSDSLVKGDAIATRMSSQLHDSNVIHLVHAELLHGKQTVSFEVLTFFLTKIAPRLPEDHLRLLLERGGGGWDFDQGPKKLVDSIRSAAEKHLGYPKKPDWVNIGNWVDAILTKRSSFPNLFGGTGSSSLLIELARHDFVGLISNPKNSLDVGAIARLANASTGSSATGNYFLDPQELSKPVIARLAKERTFGKGSPLTERAAAWRSLADRGLILGTLQGRFLRQVTADINRSKNANTRLVAAGALLSGNRIDDPDARETVIDAFVDAAVQVLGAIDDGSERFRDRVKGILGEIRGKIPLADLQSIGTQLSRRVESQRECSYLIEEFILGADDDKSGSLFALGVFAESILEAARRNGPFREDVLNFLLSDGKNDALRKFGQAAGSEGLLQDGDIDWFNDDPNNSLNDNVLLERALTTLSHLHRDFWQAPLEFRAVFARELLPPEADASVNSTLSYVVDKILPKGMEFRDQTELRLRQYVHALPDHSKHLALSALLTAGEPGQSKKTLSAGKILVTFAESMGPAEIKFVQALMDAPGLQDGFRTDLVHHGRHLKYRAKQPSRADIFRWVDIIEKREGRSFGRIGSLCGCGSINVVMRNEDRLLCLRRPNAIQRGEDGFDTMLRMIDSMERDDPFALWLRPIIDQARNRMALEGNFKIAKEQYDLGASNCDDYEVVVDGEVAEFRAAKVFEAGEDFYTMSEMEGAHFIDLLEQADGKIPPALRRMGKALLVREMNNIIRGRFDCDRHGGQVKIAGQIAGHFDFKAMSLNDWPLEGHRQFARILSGVAFQGTDMQAIPEHFLAAIDSFRAHGQEIHPFVTEAQKALVSLGDYFHAIHPASREEFLQIIFTALTYEVPDDIKGVYAEEISQRAAGALPGEYSGVAPFIHGLVRTVLNGEPIPPFIVEMAPASVRPLLSLDRDAIVIRHKQLAI